MSAFLLQLANTLGLLGLVIVGRKRRWGFVVWLGSELAWAAWGYLDNNPGIYPWCALWAIINIWNWISWRKRAVHKA